MNGKKDQLFSVSGVVNGVSQFLEEHLRQLNWTAYGIGIVGVGIALRSLRFATKFKSIDKVPKDFIRKNVRLCGRVNHVADGSVLQVDHIPIVGMPWHKWNNGLLAVKLIGISPTVSSTYRLKFIVDQQKIWFRPIVREDNALHCIIYDDKSMPWNACLNVDVVKQGTCSFAAFDERFNQNKYYRKMHKKLVEAERVAKKKRLGMWYVPTKWDVLKSKLKPSLIKKT